MKEKASDIVYDLIRNKLVTGEWPCNSEIMSEAEIAKATGASRSSVREGIDRLVKAGVLVRRQGDGTYVRNISPLILMTRLRGQAQAPASLLEILDFREMVEPEAVKRLIRNDDRSSLQTMISTLEKMQRCCELRSSDEYAQADSEFHFAILRGAHNSILERAIHIIQEQLIVYQYSANQMIGARPASRSMRPSSMRFFKRTRRWLCCFAGIYSAATGTWWPTSSKPTKNSDLS